MNSEQYMEYLKNSTSLIIDSNKINLSGVDDCKYLTLQTSQIEFIDKILNEAKAKNISFGNKPMIIEISNNAYLTRQQCENLVKNRDELRSMGCDLKVLDGDFWDLEDIFEANEHLDKAVDKIKNATIEENGKTRHLNEMERFLMAYMFVTNRKYHENEENKSSSRKITSILKTEDIVCVGFATLLQEMCNRLDIECYRNACGVKSRNDNEKYGHENNIVVIDGNPYYCDACWDCIQEDREEKHFNYCLLPCDDALEFNSCVILNPDAPYTTMNADKERAIEALEQLKITERFGQQECFKLTANTWFKKYIDVVYKDVNPKPDLTNPFKRSSREEIIQYLEKLIVEIDKKNKDNFYTLDAFENALRNVYKANGYDEERANKKVDAIIENNIEKAGKIFMNNATNCFAKEYNKSLEL